MQVIVCLFLCRQLVLLENVRVREKIPSAFEPLMSPLTSKVDMLLLPGVISLCWSSTQIEDFINDVYRSEIIANTNTQLCLPVRDPQSPIPTHNLVFSLVNA
jgi:hypothetical protein